MDKTEYIALGIVVLAVIFYVRGVFKKSSGDCCSKGCELKSKKSPKS